MTITVRSTEKKTKVTSAGPGSAKIMSHILAISINKHIFRCFLCFDNMIFYFILQKNSEKIQKCSL